MRRFLSFSVGIILSFSAGASAPCEWSLQTHWPVSESLIYRAAETASNRTAQPFLQLSDAQKQEFARMVLAELTTETPNEAWLNFISSRSPADLAWELVSIFETRALSSASTQRQNSAQIWIYPQYQPDSFKSFATGRHGYYPRFSNEGTSAGFLLANRDRLNPLDLQTLIEKADLAREVPALTRALQTTLSNLKRWIELDRLQFESKTLLADLERQLVHLDQPPSGDPNVPTQRIRGATSFGDFHVWPKLAIYNTKGTIFSEFERYPPTKAHEFMTAVLSRYVALIENNRRRDGGHPTAYLAEIPIAEFLAKVRRACRSFAFSEADLAPIREMLADLSRTRFAHSPALQEFVTNLLTLPWAKITREELQTEVQAQKAHLRAIDGELEQIESFWRYTEERPAPRNTVTRGPYR